MICTERSITADPCMADLPELDVTFGGLYREMRNNIYKKASDRIRSFFAA